MSSTKAASSKPRVLVVGYAPPHMERAEWAGLNSIAVLETELSRRIVESGEAEIFLYGTSGWVESPTAWSVELDGYQVFRPFMPPGKRLSRWARWLRFFGLPAVLGMLADLLQVRQMLSRYPPVWVGYSGAIQMALHLRKLAKAARPHLVHIHEPMTLPPACRIALGEHIPMIATLHGVTPMFEDNPGRAEAAMTTLQANFQILDACIAVSSYTREDAIRLGALPERVRVIPNAVDCEQFAPCTQADARRHLDLGNGGLVLFCGTFQPRKRVHVLIDAFQQIASEFPNARLVLVGGGEDEMQLRQRVAVLGLEDRVLFAGKRPQTELKWWYNAADVVVNPSSSEGLAVSMLEAMACGRPVIACPPPFGQYDPLQDGETGLLASVDDSAGIAAQIRRLLTDSLLGSYLGRTARELMVREYDYEVIAPCLSAFYREVVERWPLISRTGAHT